MNCERCGKPSVKSLRKIAVKRGKQTVIIEVCKDCLREVIRDKGPTKGIFWHIIYHTLIGKVYYEWKLSQPIEGVASNEVYEMIID